MMKLHQNRFYYLYTNEKEELFITDTPPALRESGGFWHPDIEMKCNQTLYVGEVKSNIVGFYTDEPNDDIKVTNV